MGVTALCFAVGNHFLVDYHPVRDRVSYEARAAEQDKKLKGMGESDRATQKDPWPLTLARNRFRNNTHMQQPADGGIYQVLRKMLATNNGRGIERSTAKAAAEDVAVCVLEQQ